MSYSLQTSFSVMMDWAPHAYEVPPRCNLQGQTRDNSNTSQRSEVMAATAIGFVWESATAPSFFSPGMRHHHWRLYWRGGGGAIVPVIFSLIGVGGASLPSEAWMTAWMRLCKHPICCWHSRQLSWIPNGGWYSRFSREPVVDGKPRSCVMSNRPKGMK